MNFVNLQFVFALLLCSSEATTPAPTDPFTDGATSRPTVPVAPVSVLNTPSPTPAPIMPVNLEMVGIVFGASIVFLFVISCACLCAFTCREKQKQAQKKRDFARVSTVFAKARLAQLKGATNEERITIEKTEDQEAIVEPDNYFNREPCNVFGGAARGTDAPTKTQMVQLEQVAGDSVVLPERSLFSSAPSHVYALQGVSSVPSMTLLVHGDLAVCSTMAQPALTSDPSLSSLSDDLEAASPTDGAGFRRAIGTDGASGHSRHSAYRL